MHGQQAVGAGKEKKTSANTMEKITFLVLAPVLESIDVTSLNKWEFLTKTSLFLQKM
jgi:hypothetical protein